MQTDEKFVKKGSVIEDWARKLSEEAQFNVPSYTECFIAENLLRYYINHIKMPISPEATSKANIYRNNEQKSKGAANISYDIRSCTDDIYYLDMAGLANMVDKVPKEQLNQSGLNRSAIVYKPLRDAIGHTSLLTSLAKQQLNTEYENIKARLAQLLKAVEDAKKGYVCSIPSSKE